MIETNPIDEAAALWVIRHKEGPLDADDQLTFDAWIAADPRHLGAFVRLNAVRVDLRRLAALSAGRRDESDRNPLARPARTFNRRWAVAAVLIALTGVSTTWLAFHFRGEAYVSGVGEMRQVSLTDGSSMTLNTTTETRVRYSEAAREVQLFQGEALFEVAKDQTRPFVVHAGNLTVTAVGTAFAVRVDEGRVGVTVTQGVVELARTDDAALDALPPRRVSAHQRATVTNTHPVEVQPIKQEEAERLLAWRAGMVAFNGEPLAEAVAEVNRHNYRRIVVDDPTLARRPVIGTFRANDIDTFARAAAAVMDAEIVEEGDVIRLDVKSSQ